MLIKIPGFVDLKLPPGQRLVAEVLVGLAILFSFSGVAKADAITSATKARQLAGNGQFQEAYKLSLSALPQVKKEYGASHQYVAFVLDDLARFGYQLGRYEDALAHARNARLIGDKSLSTGSDEYVSILNNQAAIQLAIGDFAGAQGIYEWVVSLRASQDKSSVGYAQAAANLGNVYTELRRYDEASDLFKSAYENINKAQGPRSAESLTARLDFAESLLFSKPDQRHPHPAFNMAAEVEKTGENRGLAARAAIIKARALVQSSMLRDAEALLSDLVSRGGGLSAVDLASAYYNLTGISLLRGDVAAAERYGSRTLDQYQTVVSANHPAVGRALYNLALVNGNKGDFESSDNYYRRAIAVTEGSFGAGSSQAQMMKLERALLLAENNFHSQAQSTARDALSALERVGDSNSHNFFRALASNGLVLSEAGENPNEVINYCDRAISLLLRIRGENSSDAPPCYMAMGKAYTSLRQTGQAISVLQKAEAIAERNGSLTADRLGRALSLQAQAYFSADDCSKAASYATKAADTLRASVSNSQQAGGSYVRAINERAVADDIVGVLTRCNPQALQTNTAFEMTQVGMLRSSASAAAKIAARLTPDDRGLQQVIRQKEVLESSLAVVSRELEASWTNENSNSQQLRALGAKRTQLIGDIESITQKIASRFPDYVNLVNPAPVSVQQAQKALARDEALLMQFTEGQDTRVWVVTRAAAKSFTRPVSAKALATMVRNLRCTLYVDSYEAGKEGCTTGGKFPKPLDTQSAHALYKLLFDSTGSLLSGIDHLYMVLDGPMQRIPPAMLLAQPAPSGSRTDYAKLAYLNEQFSISLLPSVGSLGALKAQRGKSARRGSFAGFGDPDFNPRNAQIDRETRQLFERMGALPNTADEIRSIAQLLGAGNKHIYLGQKATEQTVKTTNFSGIDVLAFATHGLTTEETKGVGNEPALVLTPPARPVSVDDDGLLKASEIAGLNLDANWVLLSACNTASSVAEASADGLSGLARSFFYAGARGILVSHWAVETKNTERLMKETISYYTEGSSRAESLQNAMYNMYTGSSKSAHPGFWSPFVHVGLR